MRFKPDQRWDTRSRKEVRERQAARLRRLLLRNVIPFSPFYRAMFRREGVPAQSIRTLDDFAKIPFTTKADVMPSEENPDGPRSFILQPTPELVRNELPRSELLPLLLRRLLRGERHVKRSLLYEYNPVKMLFTTGRSASSLPFFLTRYDLEILRETGRRIVAVLDLDPESDKVVSLFPYAPHLAFWQVAACAEAAGVLTLNTGGGRVMETGRVLDIFTRLKPTCVCGMPGYFYHLLRKARNEGYELPFLHKVALGGEKVSPTLKAKIVDILVRMGAKDPKVSSVFGFTEARQCWAECTGASDTGFHTSPDLGLVEIVDPETGEVVGDGETGELVYTTLDGRGSVLLRYRTGDIIEGGMTYEPCPGCGRRSPRVMSHVSRRSNVKALDISKIKGTYVNFNSLSQLLDDDGDIEEWQVVIEKPNDDPFEVDQIRLYAALTPSANVEAFRERTQRAVLASTEIRFNEIVVTSLDDMLERVGMEVNTKEVRILDRRPSSSAPAPEAPARDSTG